VDDPTLDGNGRYGHDSEGVRGARTVLIEGGRLVGFMNSREGASRLGDRPNGHARAASYGSPPLVRMSNTHMASGGLSLDELLEGVGRGLYMCGEHGGVVNPSSGEFLFKCKEGRLIERGELGAPVRDAALTGNVAATLLGVSGVGRDVRLVHMPGACGKRGQLLPVDLGGPHVRVEGVRIGGAV
jgi:TldD protein